MRSNLGGAASVLTLVLGIIPPSAGEEGSAPEIADRILAVVDARPLLLSTVRTLEAVRRLDRGTALEAVIDERLMFQEASRLPQAQVTADEEQRALVSLQAAHPELEGSVSVPEQRRLLRRQLVILKYVEFRFRPQIRISEDALREAWNDDYRGQPEGPAFEEVRPALRERLERLELDRRIEAWVSDLRQRAEVRYVAGPASPPRPESVGP
jgi:hypothetical protein